mgnify:CR=1 FL=1
MKLLFITQKLHGQDAFTALWVKAFIELGYEVTVLCLEWQPQGMRDALGTIPVPQFTVHSLGKERGKGRVGVIFNFLRHILTLKYDRVFIHMTPVWGLVGAPVWIVRRTPVYLWYTHYKMQAGLWLLGFYGKRLFCATPQSLPQYPSSSGKATAKKVVVGHGVDLAYWPRRANAAADPYRLLVVHRLSRSKRLELSIRALTLLPEAYRLDVYGIEAEAEYVAELRALVAELGLASRIAFHGTVPMQRLPGLYTSYRLILNMASETIDKTMLEALTCGCYPVTTSRNAAAIGIPAAPQSETPEAIADFVERHAVKVPLSGEAMYEVVRSGHSLEALVATMDAYIRPGT